MRVSMGVDNAIVEDVDTRGGTVGEPDRVNIRLRYIPLGESERLIATVVYRVRGTSPSSRILKARAPGATKPLKLATTLN